VSHHQRVPGIRFEQTGEHADQGGLPGPVGAKKAEDLTPKNVKGNAVDCSVLSKAAVQVLYLDSKRIPHERLPLSVVVGAAMTMRKRKS
jgi:hypothetical protein